MKTPLEFRIVDDTRRRERYSPRFAALGDAVVKGKTALVPYGAATRDGFRVTVTSNLGRRIGPTYQVRTSMRPDGLLVWAELVGDTGLAG